MFFFRLIFQGPEQIHVSKFYKESKTGKFVNYITDDATTLYETFRKGAYESNNGPCLGWRESLSSPYSVRNLYTTILPLCSFPPTFFVFSLSFLL